MRSFARLTIAVFSMLSAAVSLADVYDLAADWSDLTNPFGPWRLEKNHLQDLFAINLDWLGGQLAWADEPAYLNAHVPVWMKLTSDWSADEMLGDVLVHGAEVDRTGTNVTSAVLVCPVAGTAAISGWVWDAQQLGRTMEWHLFKNDVDLTSGLLSGSITNRLNPMNFVSGSGGPTALTQNVQVGDRLELRWISIPPDLGSFMGVEFAVQITTQTITATTTTVNPGIVVSGTPADLSTTNDVYYVLRPGIVLSSTQSPIVLNASYTLPAGTASTLSSVIESRAQQTNIRQTIEAFNFGASAYVLLNQQVVPTTTPDTVVTSALSPPGGYIGPGNEVRLKVSYKAVGLNYPWRVFIDEATLRFTP